LRPADFDCVKDGTCYDPAAISGWGAWSVPELLVAVIFAFLVLLLLANLLRQPEKPKPPIREAVDKILKDLEDQATRYNRPEAATALKDARSQVAKEFSERGI
jgi:hypothetical protein